MYLLLLYKTFFFLYQCIDPDIDDFIQNTLKNYFDVAVVGGSDLKKIKHQLGGDNFLKKYDYIFSENGLVAFKNGKNLPSEVFIYFIN